MEGVPSHIIVEKGSRFWIPMERAVQVVKLVFNFLAPRKLAIYCRQIEKHAHVLYKNGTVGKGDGARMVIRSVMRTSMLQSNKPQPKPADAAAGAGAGGEGGEGAEGGGAEGGGDGENQDSKDCQIVVDMYDALELIMEILTLRTHHMEDQLKRFFIEGDDNGDGVLSFEEFDTLLKRIAPQFSERR
jgi:hypothetical protein